MADFSLDSTYSAKGAARPSQAEIWAGMHVLQDGDSHQGWSGGQQTVMPGDWMSHSNPYSNMHLNTPLDPVILENIPTDQMYGMDPATYPGSPDISYLQLPQNQQELLNASRWDEEASLLVGDCGAQSNLMGGDPRMGQHYSQFPGRGFPAAHYQVPMGSAAAGGMMSPQYAALQASQPQAYARRAERR